MHWLHRAYLELGSFTTWSPKITFLARLPEALVLNEATNLISRFVQQEACSRVLYDENSHMCSKTGAGVWPFILNHLTYTGSRYFGILPGASKKFLFLWRFPMVRPSVVRLHPL